MIDDIFVFDLVVHLHDMSDANLLAGAPWASRVRELSLGLGDGLRAVHGHDLDHATRVSAQTMGRLVFDESPTDVAMAQVVPVFDWYDDWWAPVELQAAFARAFPGRALFCGGVDPGHRGVAAALQHLDYQVRELGAVSLKFYNGHVERGWRCDDEKLAYPLYERARQLGVTVLQFHKGNPFGVEDVEQLRPNDLQRAARDFPDLTFVIHHLATPYFDECVNIAARFPNIHLALSAAVNFLPFRPRLFQRQLGELLAAVGAERLLWGSEATLAGPPAPYLRAFMDLRIADDLREGYGYPQITREDKRLILGLNAARLFGVAAP
ncbi:amidohydrolase family protein [Nonomuraea sp. LPB2021202275-12-8]|uniref:amidohydrolase family protein n=1 Tax=Nonomuraea sp. LPB2021202275-12-8 TaxID=3120159 RepID=UPI00300CAF52